MPSSSGCRATAIAERAGFGNRYGLSRSISRRRSARRNFVLRSSARQRGETPLPRPLNIRFFALTELLQFIGCPLSGGSRHRSEGFYFHFDPSRTPECSVGLRSNSILRLDIK